jgi:hypothetical protein
MGMFDNIKCSYPLPINNANLSKELFQTKSTPAQLLDLCQLPPAKAGGLSK